MAKATELTELDLRLKLFREKALPIEQQLNELLKEFNLKSTDIEITKMYHKFQFWVIKEALIDEVK